MSEHENPSTIPLSDEEPDPASVPGDPEGDPEQELQQENAGTTYDQPSQ